jgi:hypothetical protein
MKSNIDRPAIRRKATLAHVTSLGGFVVLMAGVLLPLWLPVLANLAVALIIVGFALCAVGIFLANRWVKKPRPEDVLDKALKSLSDQFALYHYLTPWDHVLVGPSGVMLLEVINLDGVFTYENHRWKQKISISRALRYFFDERLGDPTQRAQQAVSDLRARLQARLPDCGAIPISGIVLFIHPLAEVNAKDTPVSVCNPKNLQKRITGQGSQLTPETYQNIQAALAGWGKAD